MVSGFTHAPRDRAAIAAIDARCAVLYGEKKSASASGASAAPNLESSPQMSRAPGYSVTVMDFGGGVVEARAVFCDQRVRVRAKRDPNLVKLSTVVEPSAEKIEWRRRRTARALRNRCLSLRADHMLTFTKRGKFETVDDVTSAWRRMYKILSRLPNLEFRYVAVPELHGDGVTWHLHVAVNGMYDVGLLRRCWYRALGGRGDERGDQTPGSVNARYFPSRRKGTLIVASYMAKYMGKSFTATGGGRRAFWATKGLTPVAIHRFYEPYGDCALIRVRDRVAPMVPHNTSWRLFEWEYVGLSGFIMKTF